MKYYSILFLLFLFPFLLVSQKEGIITYQQTTKLDFKTPKDMPQEFKERIPKSRSTTKELLFVGNESMYRNTKKLKTKKGKNGEVEGGRGAKMRMRMMGGGRAKEITYKNLDEKLMVDQKDLMSKLFLIKDSLETFQWKMTGQKMQLLDYLCMEATTTIDDSISVSAWFTPQIPISNGPGQFSGLPGMILKIDTNEGKNVIEAISIELKPIEDVFEQPKKGKEVTLDEFKKIRREKMKEMRTERGRNGGGFRVRRGRG